MPATIQRVASFLGKQLSQEESDRLCEHLSIENFRNNKSINYEEFRELGLLAPNEAFVRKGIMRNHANIFLYILMTEPNQFMYIYLFHLGKSGGWHDYFDKEMTQQAEQWIVDNLRDTDLRYPHIDN